MIEKLSDFFASAKTKMISAKSKLSHAFNEFTAKNAASSFIEQTKIYEQILYGMDKEIGLCKAEIEILKRKNKILLYSLVVLSFTVVFHLIQH